MNAIRHIVCLWGISWIACFGLDAAAAKKPNVLFIAVDDLNDWIGSLGGHPDARTPNIDRLAARGVLFTRAYTAAPACNPSRAALLTGIRPSTSGVYNNHQPWKPVIPDAVTLPQLFKENGYHVAGSGKIFHDRFMSSGKMTAAYVDYSESWHEFVPKGPDIVPEGYPVSGIPNMMFFDWGPLPITDDAMDDHRVVSWAIQQLNKRHEKPLFLACGTYRPHLPWYAPQKYFDMFPLDQITLPKILDQDLDDVPPMGHQIAQPGTHNKVIESNNYRKAVQGYLASIAFADAQIGRLIDALDRSPLAKNTIIVLWGDHGWHLGEKQHWRKFTLWEEAARTPLIMVVPGMTQPGTRCNRTVSLLDIYPTLAELGDLPINSSLEGVSLRPLLENPDAEWKRPALTTHGPNNHAVRSERWRYIRYSDGTEELYDHLADPMEWTNLAGDPHYADAKKELAQWLPEVNAAGAPGSVRPSGSGKAVESTRHDPVGSPRMAPREALSLMEALVENGEIPPPPYVLGMDKWKLPSDASRAIGIMIRDREYLVYAPAVTRVVSGDYSDLSEVVATEIQDSGELFLRSLQSRHSDSVLGGFLFCSVDLEVVHDSFFLKKKEKRWKWTRARPLIKKGGYLAFVGPVGVSLRGHDDTYLISFDRPLENSSLSPLPKFQIEISLVEDSRINLRVAGNNIQLK